jgi:hypothetical protein
MPRENISVKWLTYHSGYGSAKTSSMRAIPVVARSLRTDLFDVRDVVEERPVVIEIVISVAPVGGLVMIKSMEALGSVGRRS